MDLLAQALMQGLLIGGTYGIIALGMGLTYGVSGVVNFAHGDFLTLGMFLALALFSTFSLDPYISVIVTFPLLVLLGAAVYYLLIRPVVGGHVLMVIQLTLGISFILQNGLLMIFGGRPQRTPAWIEAKLLLLGDVIVVRTSLVIAFTACVVLSGFLYWLLTRTDLGRSIRAVHRESQSRCADGGQRRPRANDHLRHRHWYPCAQRCAAGTGDAARGRDGTALHGHRLDDRHPGRHDQLLRHPSRRPRPWSSAKQ